MIGNTSFNYVGDCFKINLAFNSYYFGWKTFYRIACLRYAVITSLEQTIIVYWTIVTFSTLGSEKNNTNGRTRILRNISFQCTLKRNSIVHEFNIYLDLLRLCLKFKFLPFCSAFSCYKRVWSFILMVCSDVIASVSLAVSLIIAEAEENKAELIKHGALNYERRLSSIVKCTVY